MYMNRARTSCNSNIIHNIFNLTDLNPYMSVTVMLHVTDVTVNVTDVTRFNLCYIGEEPRLF